MDEAEILTPSEIEVSLKVWVFFFKNEENFEGELEREKGKLVEKGGVKLGSGCASLILTLEIFVYQVFD